LVSLSRVSKSFEEVIGKVIYLAYQKNKLRVMSSLMKVVDIVDDNDKIIYLKWTIKEFSWDVSAKYKSVMSHLPEFERKAWWKFDFVSPYKDWYAMISHETRNWQKKFWFIDEARNEFVSAKYDLLDDFWNQKVAYFERWWFAWYVNKKWEEIFCVTKESRWNLAWESIRNHLQMNKDWRVLISVEKHNAWKLESSLERYAYIKDWKLIEWRTWEWIENSNRLIINAEKDFRIVRKDYVWNSIYKVWFWINENAKFLEFRTRSNVEIRIDRQAWKLSYIDWNSLFERHLDWRVIETKFVEKPLDFFEVKQKWFKTWLWEDGHVYVLDRDNNIKFKFQTSKEDYVKKLYAGIWEKSQSTRSYRNLEVNDDFLLVHDWPESVKLIPKHDISPKFNWSIDINAYKTIHSLRPIWDWNYIIWNKIWKEIRYELVSKDLKPILKEKIEFEFIYTSLSDAKDSKMLVVKSGENDYMINLEKMTAKKLPSKISHIVSFDENWIGRWFLENDYAEVVINNTWKELAQEGWYITVWNKKQKIKRFEVLEWAVDIESVHWTKMLKHPDGDILLQTNTTLEYWNRKHKIADYQIKWNWLVEVLTIDWEILILEIKNKSKNILFTLWSHDSRLQMIPKTYIIDNKNWVLRVYWEWWKRAVLNIGDNSLILTGSNIKYKWKIKELGLHEYTKNWKTIFVPENKKFNFPTEKYNYMHTSDNKYFYFIWEGWTDVYKWKKLIWSIPKELEVLDSSIWYAVVKKWKSIWVYDVKNKKFLLWPTEDISEINIKMNSGWNKLNCFIVKWKDWKVWAYFRDWKEALKPEFDNLSFRAESSTFIWTINWTQKEFNYASLRKENKTIFSKEKAKKVTVEIDMPLLKYWSAAYTWYWAEEKAKKIINSKADNYVWESGNVVKALYETNAIDFMSGLSIKSRAIHPEFSKLLSRLYASKWKLNLNKELDETANKILDEYIVNLYKTRARKLWDKELEFIYWTYKKRMIKEIENTIADMKEGKSLPTNLHGEKKAYLESFSKLYKNKATEDNIDRLLTYSGIN
jgi:hypothetical protein